MVLTSSLVLVRVAHMGEGYIEVLGEISLGDEFGGK